MATDVDETAVPTDVIEALLDGIAPSEGAVAWVRWMWAELAQGGLLPTALDPRQLRYVDNLIVLATLCRSVELFIEAERSTSESVEPPDLTDLPSRWGLTHSQLLQATVLDLEPEVEENTTGWLSSFVITEQEHGLAQTLAETIGVDGLFASLWAVSHGAPHAVEDEFGDPVPQTLSFPLDAEQRDGVLAFDLTMDKLRMFEWVQEWSGVRA